MTALHTLQSLLSSGRALDLAKPRLPELDKLHDTLTAKMLAGDLVKPSVDRLVEAVREYLVTQQLSSATQGKRVAFSLFWLEPNQTHPALMEPAILKALLGPTGFAQYRDARDFRKCYAGLLTSFFSATATQRRAAGAAWEQLRLFLEDNINRIGDGLEGWVSCIRANRTTLSATPCERYMADYIRGRKEALTQLMTDLSIPQDSWFCEEILLAYARHVSQLKLAEWPLHLPNVLSELGRNAAFRDAGLALLLDGYAAQTSLVNVALQEAALQWWGVPWLLGKTAYWSLVLPSTKQLVEGWLKSEYVRAFFTKLSEDPRNDSRRMAFWLRHIKQIGRIHFALDHSIVVNQDPDVVSLLNKLEGLTTPIAERSPNCTNAFIMEVGNKAVVEFGATGHACYFYDRARVPFSLEDPVNITNGRPNALKAPDIAKRVTHSAGNWEDVFEAVLADNGAKPSANPEPPLEPTSQNHSAQARRRMSLRQEDKRSFLELPFSDKTLQRFAVEYALSIDDLRSRGGNLWVRTSAANPYVNNVLLQWKFTYAKGKGWWL